MKKRQKINLKSAIELYRSIYKEMYTVAYAITGNDRTAESALANAMLMELQSEENLEQAAFANVKQIALGLVKTNPGELNFDCLEPDFQNEDPLLEWIGGLKEEERRTIMLRYGCELSMRETAEALGKSVGYVREMMERIHTAGARFAVSKKRLNATFRKTCRSELENASFAPDYNSVIRAAELLNATGVKKGKIARPMRRAVSWLFAFIFMVALVAMLWLCTILFSYYRGVLREERQKEMEYQSVGAVHECVEVVYARF